MGYDSLAALLLLHFIFVSYRKSSGYSTSSVTGHVINLVEVRLRLYDS